MALSHVVESTSHETCEQLGRKIQRGTSTKYRKSHRRALKHMGHRPSLQQCVGVQKYSLFPRGIRVHSQSFFKRVSGAHFLNGPCVNTVLCSLNVRTLPKFSFANCSTCPACESAPNSTPYQGGNQERYSHSGNGQISCVPFLRRDRSLAATNTHREVVSWCLENASQRPRKTTCKL